MTTDKKISSKKGVVKTKKIKKIPEGKGIIHGKFSFNNTIVTLSREDGRVLTTVSAGSIGFKNTKKGTPYAAQKVAEEVIRRAVEYGINNIELHVKGIGAGRDAVMKRVLEEKNLNNEAWVDKTPIPRGGGCRPPKKPRK